MVNREGKQEKTLEEKAGKGALGDMAKFALDFFFIPGGTSAYLSRCAEGDVRQKDEHENKGKENWDEGDASRYDEVNGRNSPVEQHICYALGGIMDTAKLVGYAYLAKSIYDVVVG